MGLYIKEMKMPKSCEKCMMRDGIFCMASDYKRISYGAMHRREEWCPLIDLGKHGDLIDRDKVIPKLNFINEAEHQIYGRASWGFTAKCINTFDDAPTVIEEEDGT